jgi:hypothetical protein
MSWVENVKPPTSCRYASRRSSGDQRRLEAIA